ncbi:hypothetical protein [Sphingomonas sp.]|uniref:hypothetical protein n=1 Tax=Sphingomonas sp. TaxID=28214 RepID=UPI0028ADF200|nr:hypothetical protein [Sphingomonas sp.]
MSDWQRSVAKILQGKSASDRIGAALDRTYPIGSAGPFDDLLRAIDTTEANRDGGAAGTDGD